MRLGLLPISAKPYHAGHHALVTKAAMQNDEVLLYVSLSDRKRKGEFPISGASMKRIWEEEIEKILPGNVTVIYGGSPIKHVYKVLEDAEEKAISEDGLEHVYTVYSDPVDTATNFSERNRVKYFPTAYNEGLIRFAAEVSPQEFTRGEGTPNIRGADLRAALQKKDLQTLALGMPPGVDVENVYNILQSQFDEQIIRDYVRILIG